MASLFEQARTLANSLKSGAQKALTGYAQAYQKAAPYVPFAPKITTPQAVQKAPQTVANILRPAIQSVARTPVAQAIPFTAPVSRLAQQTRAPQPTIGTVATAAKNMAVDTFKQNIYNPQTKKILPNNLYNKAATINEAGKKYGYTSPQYRQANVDQAMSLASNYGMGLIAGTVKPTSPITTIRFHADDKNIMTQFAATVERLGKQANKADLGQIGKDAQNIVEHYFGKKFANLSNTQIGKLFDYALAKRGGGVAIKPKGTPIPLGLQAAEGEGLASQAAKAGVDLTPPGEMRHQFKTSNLNIGKEGIANAEGIKQAAANDVNRVVGDTLSHKEVMAGITDATPTINSAVTREQTKQFEQSYLKTKQQFAAMAKEGKATPEAIDTFLNLQSAISDAARRLEIQKQAVGPKEASKVEEFLKKAYQIEKDGEKIKQAAQGVDFNNAEQAAEFYRKFVKPKATEWLDLLRYNSMLSSPNTHINNAFSNALGSSTIAPIEKSVTGAIDFLGSKITGNQQQSFAGEGPAYVKGYFSKVHDAAHNFADVLRGVKDAENLDTQNIPLATKGVKGAAAKVLSVPMRLLSASDEFFKTLTQGGEEAALNYKQGKGVNVGDIAGKAKENAKYRLYQQDLFKPGQGTLLDAVDHVTASIQGLRNSSNPIVKTVSSFTVPFLRTPMNILKQGIEYSPAGLGTLPGSTDKSAQLAKAAIGSSAMIGTAMLVSSGRTTWAEPTDPKERDAFRAAGLQPYAMKIGDQWVSYSKLPPQLSFPIALVSALHQAQEEKKINQDQLDVILGTIAKSGNFFADQSYLKSLGDTLAAIKGSPEQMTRLIGNYPQQLIPFRALSGWMARITDPYQRKVDADASFLERQTQQLMTQIPGLSQQVPPRLDSMDNPIENQNRLQNAVSPLKVTTEQPIAKRSYDTLKGIKQIRSDLKETTMTQADRIDGLKTALQSGTPDQRKQYILQSLQDGTLKKEDIKAYAKQLTQKSQGFTGSDEELAGASNAVRARYIRTELEGKTPDEKKAILLEYAKKKILTKETLLELAKSYQK